MLLDDDVGGFKAYKTYLAIKQHFKNPTYDYFQYEGEIRANIKSYQKRNDRYFFYKIGKKYHGDDLLLYFVANLFSKPDRWIGELGNDEAKERFFDMRKRHESIEYYFTQDCEKLLDEVSKAGLSFNDIFKVHDNKHPAIVKAVLRGKISTETYIIIDSIVGFSDYLNKTLDEPLVYGNLKKRCDKYKPFIKFDMKRCKNILRKLVIDYDLVDKST